MLRWYFSSWKIQKLLAKSGFVWQLLYIFPQQRLFWREVQCGIAPAQGGKRGASHWELCWDQVCPIPGATRALLSSSHPARSITCAVSAVSFLTRMTPGSILGFPWGIFWGSVKQAEPWLSLKAGKSSAPSSTCCRRLCTKEHLMQMLKTLQPSLQGRQNYKVHPVRKHNLHSEHCNKHLMESRV